MFTKRIHAGQLEEAINPALYEPALVAWKDRLFANKRSSRIAAQATSNPGFAFPSEVFIGHGNGEPVIRIGDLSDGVLDTNSCVNVASHYTVPDGARISAETCLVAMTGATIGKSGFKGSDQTVLINQRVLALTPADGADAGFLFACLLHEKVRQQIEAYASGAAQPNISDWQILQCVVPRFNSVAAHYVGDKVRQADQLKTYARILEVGLNCSLEGVVPPYEQTPRMCSHVPSNLLGDRFDNQPYRTHFLSLVQAVLSVKHDRIDSIAELTGGAPVPSELFGSEGVPLVRIRDISPQGFSRPEAFVPPNYVAENSYASAQEGWIVVGMDGEFRAQFFLKEELPQFVNQRVAILRAHSIRPELLTFWINRTEGQMQLNRWTTQTTVGHIRLDDIRNLLVPRFEEAVENDLADKYLMARRSDWYVQALTLAAKLFVEALIEGKLTEEELVTAQESLERDDYSADRTLLSRLTNQGIDVPGQPPLFPDLDALYALLAESKEYVQ